MSPVPFLAVFMALSISAVADPISDRIAVTVRGQGPDVVLIPGMTCSSDVWDEAVVHLQGHYRLHLVQIDGFAGSPSRANADGPVTQPVLDSLDAYIKANHLKSPAIIGHSYGGSLGMMLAIQHPEDVGRLMIVDSLPFTSMFFGISNVVSATRTAAKLRDHTLNESQHAYARGQKRFIPYLVKSRDDRKRATAWAVASDKSVVARASYEDMTTDLRPALPEITAPVTILYPCDHSSKKSKDKTDAFYHQAFAALPNKTMVRIDGSYHFIMLDQPEAFLAQVDRFLK